MGNRSKFVAVTAAAGAFGLNALRVRRRARLEHAADGNAPSKPAPTADAAHAPGHQHLHRTAAGEEESTAPRLRGRPWTKNAHGLRHSIRG